ncbi:MAG: HAD-IA family hydrolase [Rubellimicrobium sp.]|nr:HAD-IA family hydrolase [Rubellimicrobium sp.]
MQPKAVVYDIGRVLIHWDPRGFYDRVIGPEARARLFAEVDLDGMNIRVDNGSPWRETVHATAEAHPGWADAIRLWHDRWIEMASPAIDRSVRLMRALRARGVPVFALTNFGRESFAHARTLYDFFNEFDGAVVSGEHGVMKPEARIYELVEEMSGLAGADLLFADDNADNIAAARARGWRAHLFEHPEGWAARLVEEGLLSEEEAA